MSAAMPVPEWVESGLCAQVDPAIFFPEQGIPPAPARRICAQCPVKAPCLDYALDLARAGEAVAGVWGGTTETERRRLRGPRRCLDCDAEIPDGKGAALRRELHRETRRRAQYAAYEARRRRRMGAA